MELAILGALMSLVGIIGAVGGVFIRIERRLTRIETKMEGCHHVYRSEDKGSMVRHPANL